ncbi:MAG: CDP-glycerol glycerophosphotransferase family protein [Mogibacterium sp.]|nr:CDP-glycerol glycerophosphotransferase family protein [Mogibacterium sp.]
MVKIKVMTVNGDTMELAGVCPGQKPDRKPNMHIRSEKGEDVAVRFFPMPFNDKTDSEGNLIRIFRGFRAKLPLYDGAVYSFYTEGKSKDDPSQIKRKAQEISFGRRSRLQDVDGAYVDSGAFIIRRENDSIRVNKASWMLRKQCAYRYSKTLKAQNKEYLMQFRKDAEILRKNSRPIVLIADRVNMARDNGEALFNYLMANGYDKKYDVFFCVRKDTTDYERVSRVGKVLDFGSDEYKVHFLAAQKIITSGFDRWFTNAFGDDFEYMADMYTFDHYFLQHGVIMNDWSRELNYTNRGFKLFCTTTESERDSILADEYGYTEDEVQLTGLPRFDLLEDRAKKLIVFAPTWRVDLAGEIDSERGSRLYSETLRNSEYRSFYNSLINDRRLLDAMRKNGYRGEFYLHPSFIANYTDFEGNDVIGVYRDAEYNRIFCEASILVTDYSSVNIDFAYLGKPVVYSQFDKDTFFNYHGCGKGYFDYQEDGFGPVCTSIEAVTDTIIKLIDNECIAPKEYINRAERFFKYRDNNNCKRVAEAIFGKEQEG